MKTLLIKLMALTLILSACSSSKDAVEEAFKNVPVPDTTQGAEIAELGPQQISDDVPTVETDASYHGSVKADVDTLVEFTLIKGKSTKIVDLEFEIKKKAELKFADMATSYIGKCSSWTSTMTWMEVNPDGVIVDEYLIGWFDTWSVEKGRRYLLRLTYENTTGCDSFTNTIKITKE